MTNKFYKEKEKCVKCGEGEGKYCSSCYQTLKAEYVILETEHRNTIRSLEYDREKRAI